MDGRCIQKRYTETLFRQYKRKFGASEDKGINPLLLDHSPGDVHKLFSPCIFFTLFPKKQLSRIISIFAISRRAGGQTPDGFRIIPEDACPPKTQILKTIAQACKLLHHVFE
jgi:hypothetical protein